MVANWVHSSYGLNVCRIASKLQRRASCIYIFKIRCRMWKTHLFITAQTNYRQTYWIYSVAPISWHILLSHVPIYIFSYTIPQVKFRVKYLIVFGQVSLLNCSYQLCFHRFELVNALRRNEFFYFNISLASHSGWRLSISFLILYSVIF